MNSSNNQTLEIVFVNIHLDVNVLILMSVEWISFQFPSLDGFEPLTYIKPQRQRRKVNFQIQKLRFLQRYLFTFMYNIHNYF